MTNLLGEHETDIAAVSVQDFKDFWNEQPNLPSVIVMNTDRRRKLSLRMKQELFRKHWKHLITAMNADTQYHGDKGWQKHLMDFFLRNDMNWVRVLESHPVGVEAKPQKSKWAI